MGVLQNEELRVLLTAQEQRAISLLPGIVFRPHPEDNAEKTPCQKQGAINSTIFRGGKTVLGGVSSSSKRKAQHVNFVKLHNLLLRCTCRNLK